MKTTKGDAYDASMTMHELLTTTEDIVIPQTAAYRLSKMYPKLKTIGLEVEREMIRLAQIHGTEQLHPTTGVSLGWNVPETTREAYNEELRKKRDEELELDIMPIQIAAFGTGAKGLTVRHFVGLHDFIQGEPLEA